MPHAPIVLTPEHLCDPALAIAAVRAGGLGLLDLGFSAPHEVRRRALAQLARFSGPDRERWGARWNTWGLAGRMPEVLEGLVDRRLPFLLVAGAPADRAADVLRQGRRLAARVLLEVYDGAGARAAAAHGFDGIVLAGNEAGGRVGRASAFLLLQGVREGLDVPFWIRGAFGPETAAAALLAGAEGVALAEELWLAREAPFDAADRARFTALDGSETLCLGEGHERVRLFAQADRAGLRDLAQHGGEAGAPWREALLARWREAPPGGGGPLPLGQGVGLAADLARRYGTVGRILEAFATTARHHLEIAPGQRALAPDAPLAAEIGIRTPIVQGPMTRVSDTPAFALAVAEHGALPFLALALLRGAEAKRLLVATRRALGDRPWGVGLLGFIPAALRDEQMQAISEVGPGFGIIAGGRPSQAAAMEALGVRTWLHVPSPGLLGAFLEQGARRFILEGRECGGHVGPRSSFALWQSAIDVLGALDAETAGEVRLLFAGGIHDAFSAAMVETLAAGLVERGVRIGVLIGTAYLFTPEAVETGAISPVFQDEAVACRETALLTSGLGHATRCAKTPFVRDFEARRAALLAGELDPEQVRIELEMLNVGRLRLAAKARTRSPGREGARGDLVGVDEATQRREGLFMLGEVAALRDGRQSMAALHDAVSRGSTTETHARSARVLARVPRPVSEAGEPIAIVGMACIFPEADDLRAYWENIVLGVDAVRDVPADRWRTELHYDRDRRAKDRLYARRGAFLSPQRFDPVAYGIPPAIVGQIEAAQLLALEVAKRAIADAGFDARPFPRERTSVIFGSSGIHDLGIAYAHRTMVREFLARADELDAGTCKRVVDALARMLPEWTEDSFPGVLPNVITGRIANRLDLRGANFVVDAACSASLAAVAVAVGQLRNRSCDVAVAGAVDCSNNAFTFMGFAKTQALTPGDHPRPFDARADGIVLGEGVGAVVLKRLCDAERDGDDIRAVIRGVGFSSDGRGRSLTAPRVEGQMLALERAYEDARLDPSGVELVEAHATGTTVGDTAEIEALRRVFGRGDARCALGSVKSQIGHAKTAAGMAGLIKTALALETGVLPPTLHVEEPNARLLEEGCPFYVNTACRPWIRRRPDKPRRAGVSAFGFGGTDFHLVLESWDGAYLEDTRPDLAPRPAEIFAWRRPTREALAEDLRALGAALEGVATARLDALAAAVFRAERAREAETPADGGVRLAIVASTREDLDQKLDRALALLAGDENRLDALGLYLSDAAPRRPEEVAFLFPGQGAQHPGMLADLVALGPFGPALFETADRLLADHLERPLSTYVFPPPPPDENARKAQAKALEDTRVAQPAVGAIELFAIDVLARFGLAPAAAAGHSYGEYTALCAAGVYSREDLLVLSAKRGRAVHRVAHGGTGGMLAVAAWAQAVEEAIDALGLDVRIANVNAPRQTIVAGPREAIQEAAKRLPERGLAARRVAVSAAFHTPAVREASESLVHDLDRIRMRPPDLPVYSNVTAAPYPGSVAGVKGILSRHLAHPVRFVDEIRAMHQGGLRVFLEVGPGRILTGLVRRILEGEDYGAIALDQAGKPAWLSLGHLLSHVFALGLDVDLGPWFRHRGLEDRDVAAWRTRILTEAKGRPTDWWLDPGGSRPVREETPAPVVPPAEGTTVTHAVEAPPMTSASDDPALPPPDADLARRVHETTAAWLALQREQLRLNERFLRLQERLLGGGLPDEEAPRALPRMPALTPGEALAPGEASPLVEALPTLAGPAGFSVPPAPVLPPLEPEGAGAVPDPDPGAGAGEVAAEAGDAPSAETFRRDLLAEVSRRTGYPEDMLDLDLPLEAGLGIDSIKVMEIFSALKPYHRYLADPTQDEEEVLAQFTRLETLGAILAHYAERRKAAPASDAPASDAPASDAPAREAPPAVRLERRVLTSVATDLPDAVDLGDEAFSILPSGLGLVLVGDVPDLSAALGTALASKGRVAWQLVPGREFRRLDAHRFEVDLDDRAGVEEAARAIRDADEADVGGFVNLLNLDPSARRPDLQDLDAPLRLARRLLHVAQAFEDDIRASVSRGGGLVLNLTGLGGRFGLTGEGPLPVAQAASLGFVKSLAREWKGVRVQTLDVDPDADPSLLLAQLAQELARGDGAVEVGFDGRSRWRLDLARVPTPEPPMPIGLGSDAVVLVTGGARGIGALVTQRLAARTKATFVVVGRSPMSPETDEPEAVRGIEDVGRVREALIRSRGGGNGRRATPAEIEDEVRRVERARATRRGLASLEAAGARVEYHALDVRDAEGFGSLIDDVYARHGRIDGVIHAAGVIEDRRLADKTSESFARVFETKVRPALVLARRLRPQGLAFLVFFSSVSGRFGNAGQVDYSAANEVLNKLADDLDRSWPGRVVSINWGPWDAGMLSEGLREAYRRRGIGLIEPEAGAAAFLDELARTAPGASEVVLACDVGRIEGAGRGETPREDPAP